MYESYEVHTTGHGRFTVATSFPSAKSIADKLAKYVRNQGTLAKVVVGGMDFPVVVLHKVTPHDIGIPVYAVYA